VDKLVVLKGGAVQDEIALDKERLEIGRDLKSDLHLNDPSISRHHAVVIKVHSEYLIQDLDSTNGTLLNERRITKHMLKHGNLLTIGCFTLRYEKEGAGLAGKEDDMEKTVVIQTRKPKAAPATASRRPMPKKASLHYFRGPKKGTTEPIERSLYTIGKPGGEVAAIARRPQGFFLLHIGGDSRPTINSKEIPSTGGAPLKEGDVIEVGKNLVEISFK
jgi:pSer/pThr/pTyr-binding forkhead associated (FHA) protein